MLCEVEPDMEEAQLKKDVMEKEAEDEGLEELEKLEQTPSKEQINLQASHLWVY